MSALWVFGYGSLIWNPGFNYKECKVGRIDGYCRRFYQGSDVHRGDPTRLGRVVTLMEEEGVSTWGRAFQLRDEAESLAYLTNRESSIGGYTTVITQFYPRDPKEEPFPVLVYIALPSNSLFLGSAPLQQIANDIAFSKGICGPNVEYLAKLGAFMRLHLPTVPDEHLFRLEDLVRNLLEDKCEQSLFKLFDDAILQEINEQIGLKSVDQIDSTLDDRNESISSSSSLSDSYESSNNSWNQTMFSSDMTSKYTDRVTTRKLRCINK